MKASASMNPYPVPSDKEWYEKDAGGQTVTAMLDSNGKIIGNQDGWKSYNLYDFDLNSSDYDFAQTNNIWPDDSNVSIVVGGLFGDNNIAIAGTPSSTVIKSGLKVHVEKYKHSNKYPYNKYKVGDYYVLIKFEQTVTDITEDSDFKVEWSATGGGSSTYNGEEVSLDDLKENLSVTYNNASFSSYTLSVQEDKTIKDAGDYTIVITPTTESGLIGYKTIQYSVSPAELTVKINDKTITLPGETAINTTPTLGETETLSLGEGSTIYTGDEVTFTGAITTAENVDLTKPGEYKEGLINDQITSNNKNYKVTNVTPGTLTVEYNITDQNYNDAFTVTVEGEGDGTYTYGNKEHGATVSSKIEGVADCLEVWYKEANGEVTQNKPKHVGEYTVVIKKKANCPYIDIPENGITTNTKIVINPIEISITGSLTVEQNSTLEESYDADELNLEATETGIEGLTLKFEGSATPNDQAVTNVANEEGIENAFNVQTAEGWTINITEDKQYFLNGDITIKDINIKLIVTPESKDWTDASIDASVTIYVNENGDVVGIFAGGSPDVTTNTVTISADYVLGNDWSFAETDGEPTLSPDEENGLTWAVNENGDLTISGKGSTVTEETVVKVKVVKGEESEGYMTVTFEKVTEVKDGDITKGGEGDLSDGELLYGEGKHVIYDGNEHGLDALEVNGKTFIKDEDYDVYYNYNETPIDAGTYTAYVTFKESKGYYGYHELPIRIDQRPLTLTFVFENVIEEGEPLYYTTIEDDNLVAGEQITDNNIDVTFETGEPDANGHCDVYIENIAFHADGSFNPDNYDIYVQAGNARIHLTHAEGSDTYTPAEDEGNSDFSDPVGDIEVVDQSGQSSSGITYKRYELKLANKDFYPVNCREDYAAEGIELLSRHDKKTTWEGGSFTVYYKHDGIENDGGYRVFIRRGDYGDKWEEIEQDITGYYQIRNVSSNIYVKLYYGTGFPVANEEISATDARAYAQANKIVVITPEPTDVQIISMTGAVVATDQVTGQREFANLMEGIYIVRMGDTVVKLQVRN